MGKNNSEQVLSHKGTNNQRQQHWRGHLEAAGDKLRAEVDALRDANRQLRSGARDAAAGGGSCVRAPPTKRITT